jgi:hypothetical protein
MAWLALLVPPLIWAKAAWLSPFLRTYRHGLSGALSLLAGGLMFASITLDDPTRPALLGTSAVALTAMLVALLTPSRRVR